MAEEDSSLLDVFVRVLPHPDNDDVVKDAAEKTKAMFAKIATPQVVPGATKATDDLKQGFLEAKRYADDLARQAAVVARSVKLIGDEDISSGFRTAMDQFKKARQELRESSQDKDPLGLDKAQIALDVISDKLRALRAGPLSSLPDVRTNNDRFFSIRESEKQNRSEFNIDTAFRRQFDKGLDFAQKEELARLIRDVKLAEAAFDSLERTFKRTGTTAENQAEQLRRLNEASQNLGAARQGVTDTFKQRPPGVRSSNALSNNAYQLGQAFEDAAVGFQLNGFAGAVRGSANNIAFIINDLSQMESIQNKLPKGWAQQLPLIAGIGSAIAITVLPKLIEWLQTLNDIEVGFKDISKELEGAFEGRDFSIKSGLDNDALEKSVTNATALKDVLEKIRELNEQNVSRKGELKSIFAGFDTKELRLDDLTPFQNIDAEFEKLATTIQKTGEALVVFRDRKDALTSPVSPAPFANSTLINNLYGLVGAETPETAIANLRTFRQEVFAIRRTIEDTVEKGKEGTATPETFIRAQRQIDEFRKNLDTKLGRLEISKEERAAAVTTFTGITDALSKDLKRAEELSKQTAENITEQFEIAFEGARNKVRELQNQLIIGQQISEGKNVKFDAELLTLNEQIGKGRLLVLESIQALREESVRTGAKINEEGLKAIQDSFELETQVNLKRLLQEEKILEAKKKGSQFTQLEDYAKRLQTNALSADKEDVNRRENIQRLEEAIRRNNEQRGFADVAMETRLPPSAQEQAAAFENALRVLMPPLFQILDSQNKTTDAVQKARGAVAQ